MTLDYMAIAARSCCYTTLVCMHHNCSMQCEVLDCGLSYHYTAIAQLNNVEFNTQCSVKCWMTLDNIALHCITLNYMAIAQCSCCCTTLDCMHCNCLMQYEVLDCALSHYYIAIAQLDNVELLSAVLNVG